MKKLILLILPFLLFPISTPIYADDFQDGLDAFGRKDYKTAFEKLKPLAEQGDAEAQYNLGVMYDQGLGVTQDYIEAYKWHSIAYASGVELPRDVRDSIIKLMTASQINSARKLAKEWMEKHQQ